MPSADVPTPSFARRVFLMPFSVRLWRTAAHLPLLKTLLPLLVLACLAGGLLGLVRGFGLRRFLKEVAEEYDKRFDPVVYESGAVRVDGERLPRWEDGDNAFLVDPEETVALDDISKGSVIVVRSDRVLVRRRFQPDQEIPLQDLAGIIGAGPTRVDSTWLRELASAWGFIVGLGVGALLAVVVPIIDGVTCALYALLAAALLSAVRDVSFQAAFRVALACSSVTVVAASVLQLLGIGLPCACIVGPVAWTGLITALAVVALRDGLEDGPGPAEPEESPA